MASIINTRVLRAKLVTQDNIFTTENFKVESVQVDNSLQEGEILLRNLYLAIDPITRISFAEGSPRVGALNVPVFGFGVAEVIDSKNPIYPVSSILLVLDAKWEQYSRVSNPSPQSLLIIPNARNPDIPLTEYTNVLGVNGLTAYGVAQTLVDLKKGQVIYISSAAGPVGALFGILAKRAGAFIIGSAGTDEKVEYLLKEIGFDVAFNYKTKDTRAELAAAAPEGLDVYFDLVGGETLDIAIEKLKMNGLVLAVGAISVITNKGSPYVTKNLPMIISKGLKMLGFTGYQHLHRFPQMWKDLGPLIANGEIKKQKETVVWGIEKIPQVFVDYIEGKYHGKVIIGVSALEE